MLWKWPYPFFETGLEGGWDVVVCWELAFDSKLRSRLGTGPLLDLRGPPPSWSSGSVPPPSVKSLLTSYALSRSFCNSFLLVACLKGLPTAFLLFEAWTGCTEPETISVSSSWAVLVAVGATSVAVLLRLTGDGPSGGLPSSSSWLIVTRSLTQILHVMELSLPWETPYFFRVRSLSNETTSKTQIFGMCACGIFLTSNNQAFLTFFADHYSF